MNIPQIFISKDFFERLSSIEQNIYSTPENYSQVLIREQQARIIFALRQLLICADIKTDIEIEEALLAYQGNIGTREWRSFRDYILWQWVKNNRFSKTDLFNNTDNVIFERIVNSVKQRVSPSPIYLSKFDRFLTSKLANSGVIAEGKEYDALTFFNQVNVSGILSTDPQELSECAHPTSILYIVDSYILIDTPGRPGKIPNLGKAIRHFIRPEQNPKPQINIITEYPKDKWKVKYPEKKLRYICNELFNEIKDLKLEINLFMPLRLQESDRWILTSYSYMFAGHPFDRESGFAYQFLPKGESPENIQKAYLCYNKKLKEFNAVIDKTQEYETDKFDGNSYLTKISNSLKITKKR